MDKIQVITDEYGFTKTIYRIDGTSYRSQQDAFEALQTAGFTASEASDYLCLLETETFTMKRYQAPKKVQYTENDRIAEGRWRNRMMDGGIACPRF